MRGFMACTINQLYYSGDIIRGVRWVEHVAQIGEKI